MPWKKDIKSGRNHQAEHCGCLQCFPSTELAKEVTMFTLPDCNSVLVD